MEGAKRPQEGQPQPMRLQKFLARAGVASRRKSEELIAQGRVSVNGWFVTEMGVTVDPACDLVMVDGLPVELATRQVTLLLNKPAGVYSTMREQAGRECVADFLPLGEFPALYHVGRLDRDTTGALLFTTDGELGHALLHPSRHVRKEYLAQVEGTPTERQLDELRRGIRIRSGEDVHRCAPAEVDLLRKLPARYARQDSCLEPGLPGASIVRVCIHEGVKHQVKLMMGAIGHPVLNLHRASFGPIELGELPQGRWRELSPDELASLR